MTKQKKSILVPCNVKEGFAKVMLLVTVILMDVLGGAEVDLFVPSFPELKSQFELSPFLVEALLSVNFIGYVFSLLFVGGLADRYGRKPIILLGLATFILGSVLCVWAGSYEFLLLGRFLQGLGVAAPATISFLIIADSYPIKQQQNLMGIMNGLMNIAVAAAPVAGSYITMYFHWQGNFIALLILGVATLLLTMLFIPNYKLKEHKEPLSLRGFIPIFQSKNMMLMVSNMVLLCIPYWIFLGMSPILYMESLGVSLAEYGYYQGMWALVFALGSIFSGLIINRYDQKTLLSFSGLICILGLIIIVLVTYVDCQNPLLIALAFLPFSLGTIIPAIIIYPICINFMPHAKGRVSATIQGIRLILTAFGLELAGYCYQGSFQNIGIIITVIIFIGVITLFLVIKNRQIINVND